MDEKLGGLKEAYLFYKKALKEKDAMAWGCLRDADEWLLRELDKIFKD